MKVLILSANTGTGHNSVAQAVKERFEAYGDECIVEDCLSFVSPAVSKMISQGHNALYKHFQSVNNLVWNLYTGNRAAMNKNHPLYRLITFGCDKLAVYLLQEKIDAVVCTHIFAGWMTGCTIKRNNINVKTGIVETDYMPSLGCEFVDVDYHFVPTKEIAGECEALGIEKEKIIVTGIPVKKEIFIKLSNHDAKAKLNIRNNKKHVIVMCGSMGGGPMVRITHQLIKELGNSIYITVICGSNKVLYRDLKLAYGQKNNVRITKFIKEISLWMDSADVFISKPGGISITEAAVKQLPMILINTVGGCENGNFEFYVNSGAAVAGGGAKDAAVTCRELLDDDEKREQIRQVLAGIAADNDTELIVRTFHKDEEFKHTADS